MVVNAFYNSLNNRISKPIFKKTVHECHDTCLFSLAKMNFYDE